MALSIAHIRIRMIGLVNNELEWLRKEVGVA
jgi:hypothetical protein